MTVPDEWLAAVAAHPDDDLVRLACADWLEEQGEPPRRARAAFIRAQIAEYRSAEAWDGEPAGRPSQRLLARGRGAWLAGVPRRLQKAVDFERGFPEAFEVAAGSEDAAAALLASPPPALASATRLTLSGAGGAGYDALAAGPALDRLRALHVANIQYNVHAHALCRSPRLARVRALSLGCGHAPATGFEWLGAAELCGVERLSIAAGWLQPPALGPLGEWAAPRGLARFECRGHAHFEQSFAPFLRSPLLAPVRRLGWHTTCPAPDLDALAALADGSAAPHADDLAVGDFPRDGVDTLAYFLERLDRPGLKHLTIQAAAGTSPLSAFGAALAAAPRMANLESLALLGGRVDGPTAVAILESPHLRNLKRLDLEAPHADRALVRHLADTDRLSRFRSVYLGPKWPGPRPSKKLRDRLAPVLRAYPVGGPTFERLHPEGR